MEKNEEMKKKAAEKAEKKNLPLGCVAFMDFWLFIMFTLIFMGVAIKIDSGFEHGFIIKALIPGILTTAAYEFLRIYINKKRALWLIPALATIALLTTWLITIY
jgi:hypothetical protein